MRSQSSATGHHRWATVARCVQCGRLFHALLYGAGLAQRFCSHACRAEALVSSVTDRVWRRVDTRAGPADCWPFMGYRDPKGYGRLSYRGPSGERRIEKAHRAAYLSAVGPIPAGMGVLHTCDNPACCNPGHLYLGTNTENTHDRDARARRKGPFPWLKPFAVEAVRGTANVRARLDEGSVRVIRARYARGGVSMQALATDYGVHKTVIHKVVRRLTWAWLD